MPTTIPKVVEAAQFFADLGQKYEVMPKGIINWGTTPKDFFEGKTAIMWTTTGNLTNVRKNAKFAFGVAPMPSKARGGSPTGGGNIYIFKNKDKAKVAAALHIRPLPYHAGEGGGLGHRHRLYRDAA